MEVQLYYKVEEHINYNYQFQNQKVSIFQQKVLLDSHPLFRNQLIIFKIMFVEVTNN